MKEQELLPHLFKTEYRKIVAVLGKLFGMPHIEMAEDIVSDTFLAAAETWGLKGLPANPTAWLYSVAKNKSIDFLKRNHHFNHQIAPQIGNLNYEWQATDIDLSAQNIQDSQLQMMFAICHPSLKPEAQIGLSLNLLCGFGAEEIAAAFLSKKETIYKRLSRAKEKLRNQHIKIELPNSIEINNRLQNVLTTIYLLFNEGYYSSTNNLVLNKELCLEAMRLNYLLLENTITNKPAVNALMALMCFHASRFQARVDKKGETILYDDQNKNLWNIELIDKENHFLIESAKGEYISKFHIEASIAYWHCKQNDLDKKWESIVLLYDQLLQIEHSDVILLNRIYAYSKATSQLDALEEVEKLPTMQNQFYFALLGYLYTNIDANKAITHYKNAMQYATPKDQVLIEKHINSILNN